MSTPIGWLGEHLWFTKNWPRTGNQTQLKLREHWKQPWLLLNLWHMNNSMCAYYIWRDHGRTFGRSMEVVGLFQRNTGQCNSVHICVGASWWHEKAPMIISQGNYEGNQTYSASVCFCHGRPELCAVNWDSTTVGTLESNRHYSLCIKSIHSWWKQQLRSVIQSCEECQSRHSSCEMAERRVQNVWNLELARHWHRNFCHFLTLINCGPTQFLIWQPLVRQFTTYVIWQLELVFMTGCTTEINSPQSVVVNSISRHIGDICLWLGSLPPADR